MVTEMKKFTKLFLMTLLTALCVPMLTSCSLTTTAQYTGDNESIKRIYELGLVDSEAVLDSDSKLTWVQAVMLSARTHAIINGKSVYKKRGEWYDSYIKYAKKNSIIDEIPDDVERPAFKYEIAQMLSCVSNLPEINLIDNVPDTQNMQYNDSVLKLYKQGVTLGTNDKGDFFPGLKMTVTDASTLYLRVLGEEELVKGTIDKVSDDDAYDLVLNAAWDAWYSTKEGIASGWTLDNRGGVPRNSLEGKYGSLIDISKDAGTALIRHLNKTSTGIIELYTKITVDGSDGVYLEFRNEADRTVWQLIIRDGVWNYLNADSSYTELYDIGDTTVFEFCAKLDLDNCRTEIYINGTYCGKFSLNEKDDECNIYNFRYATTDISTACVSVNSVQMTANYAVNEDFTCHNENLLFDWTLDNSNVSGGILKMSENGSTNINFDTVSGNAVAEFMYLYSSADNVEYSLMSLNTPVLTFNASKSGFDVNGVHIYDCDYDDLWYRLRFEFDFVNQTVKVKVNGRETSTVQLLTYTTSIDNIVIENKGTTELSFDNFKVFRTIDHEDYVPVPVVPEDKDDYIVGLNVCPLWRNGEHVGWSCVSPYDDIVPVLGYYDEGLPETADWEIKYLVEHGVDFQAFCIYMDSGSNPQRPATKHLYDGYMNAKYSSLSKFCIIWECQNAGSPTSMEDWENNYVPYFIENYFKDSRYMTIDNRVLMCVFGSDSFINRIGGSANARKALKYLEEEIQKLGFDGMIYLACHTGSQSTLASVGFDGYYAYNFGTEGYSLETNINSILSSAKNGSLYTVPTISVGFNSIAWHGTRYPMMSLSDYEDAQEWVKNEYLTKYPEEEWQKKLVMMSTWNEYGEGTYIMPTTDERGFGYLDILREAYTSENVNTALNTVPTESQLYRIHRLYPQYLHLLRRNGGGTTQIDPKTLDTNHKIDLSYEQTGYNKNIDDIKYTADGMSGIATSKKAMIAIRQLEIDADAIDYIRIRAKLEDGNEMKIYFLTKTSKIWEDIDADFVELAAEDGFVDYYLYVKDIEAISGCLTSIRIDPCSVETTSFTISSVEFLSVGSKKLSDVVNIDGNEIKQKFQPRYNVANELCIVFDPSVGMDFALNTYHEWDKATKTLTLNFVDHVVVYRVGSDICIIDGNEEKLNCVIGTVDALPMIPIEQICSVVGYEISVENNEIHIKTNNYDYYQANKRVPQQWEFNTNFDTEGWKSYNMSLTVKDGYIACESISASTDPILYYGNSINFEASKYTKLEYRVRYKYTGFTQQLVIYYATSTDTTMDERKTLKITLNSNDSQGEWETYSLDLTQLPQWNGTVTSIRFDPFNAVGHMDVDYIRFVE